MKCPHCNKHIHFRHEGELYRATLHGVKREKTVRKWTRPNSPYGGWGPIPEPLAIALWGKYIEPQLFSCNDAGKIAG